MNVLDQPKNGAEVIVSTGYDAAATSVVLSGSEGAKLPDPSSGNYNLVWFNSTDYQRPFDDPNCEIVRVTGKSSDTLTIVRPASGNSYNGEGSSNTAKTHNTSAKVYKMVLSLTSKTINDIDTSLGSKVDKSTYDANTILIATADNTPIALTVGASTFVGRKSTGDISALSKSDALTILNVADGAQVNASGGTLTSALDLGENAGLVLDASLSADGKWSGIKEAGTAGAALTFGQLCYFNSSNKWVLAKADSITTSTNKLGICILAASGDAQPTEVLLFGKVNAAAQFPTLTVGAPVYISSTVSGAVVTTAPSSANSVTRIIGFGNTGDELFFIPSDFYNNLITSTYLMSLYVVRDIPSGTKNGSNTNFTLTNTPVSGSEMIFVNGLLMNSGSGNDYTISGSTITFAAAPLSTDTILATYWK
jgi:hypothetical protein